LDGKGNLILDFFDVYGDRPDDRVDVTLKHRELSQGADQKNLPATKSLRINDLDSTDTGIYSLQVFPLRRRAVGRFVTVLEGKTVRLAIVLPMDADRVKSIEAPAFDDLAPDLQQVLEASGIEGDEDKRGAALYGALDDARKAGMLNIYAKMKATRFADGRDTFSYVTEFTRIRSNRFFAKVAKELRDAVKSSIPAHLFHEVPGALHTPPPNFVSVDSFKTPDLYGNLQLTFFSNPSTLEFISDTDIDDAQGVEHIFQVLRPIFTGADTNPYDIHEILLQYQKIDPGYKLVV
jgi:hypothetical protein